MPLSNCENCKYFNSNLSSKQVSCAVNPAYAEAWINLYYLDDYNKSCLPIEECGDFELQLMKQDRELDLIKQDRELDSEEFTVIDNGQSKFKLSQEVVFLIISVVLVFVGIGFVTRAVISEPIYANNGFPPTLSKSAKAKVPKCIAIFDSLKTQVEYRERSKSLEQLNNCLVHTPLQSIYGNRLDKISSYYTALESNNNLDINAINRQYMDLIEDLSSSDEIYILKNYELSFYMLIIDILTFYVIPSILLLIFALIIYKK